MFEIISPARGDPSESVPPPPRQRGGQRRTEDQLAFFGVRTARSITACVHRKDIISLAGLVFCNDRRERQARPSASVHRSTPPTPWIPRQVAKRLNRRPCTTCSAVMPGHTHRQRRFVVGLGAQIAELFEPCRDVRVKRLPRVPTYQRARCDSHGHAIRRVCRQSVGDLQSTLPTELRRSDIAVDRPSSRPHMPLVGGAQVTGRFEVLGDQCGVLVILVDRRSDTPVQLRTIGLSCDRMPPREPEDVGTRTRAADGGLPGR